MKGPSDQSQALLLGRWHRRRFQGPDLWAELPPLGSEACLSSFGV